MYKCLITINSYIKYSIIISKSRESVLKAEKVRKSVLVLIVCPKCFAKCADHKLNVVSPNVGSYI